MEGSRHTYFIAESYISNTAILNAKATKKADFKKQKTGAKT